MTDGFLRVAAATPKIKVADPAYNKSQILELIKEAAALGVKVLVFPELCMTGYTCQDLFLQHSLIKQAKAELKSLLEQTRSMDLVVFLGMPWDHYGKLYNTAVMFHKGVVKGIIPKQHLPNYSEFYEVRHFTRGNQKPVMTYWEGQEIPFGANLLFQCSNMEQLVLAAEICEDVWVPAPPSTGHAMAGATVIINCSASDESVGKGAYRESLIIGQAARLVCGYIYANAGEGESTQDLVFGGHNIISENGTYLAGSRRFETGLIYADLDLERLVSERRRMSTYPAVDQENYVVIPFELEQASLNLKRFIDPAPFVPGDPALRQQRCEEIFMIQSMGLKKRLEHTGIKHAVLGISGGLDSTLALLVTVKAFQLLGMPTEDIQTVTMPCFGTTDRTYENACRMAVLLGTTLKEIDIKQSVMLHFEDIGHDPQVHDVTYENAQARERTQILMDIANQCSGLVVGTGDMSELALGWATYNGDHMSMYGVNASVPKTLVRYLVQYCADTTDDERLKQVLLDVLDTPVSPELLPPDQDGNIAQKTEDFVGPYELHDFFLYYVMRFGYRPAKIYRLAQLAFEQKYQKETILKWLKTFYRRFFSQQFKRSCLPDGPKVGSIALSPRGDLRMPSDASANIWLTEIDQL